MASSAGACALGLLPRPRTRSTSARRAVRSVRLMIARALSWFGQTCPSTPSLVSSFGSVCARENQRAWSE